MKKLSDYTPLEFGRALDSEMDRRLDKNLQTYDEEPELEEEELEEEESLSGLEHYLREKN